MRNLFTTFAVLFAALAANGQGSKNLVRLYESPAQMCSNTPASSEYVAVVKRYTNVTDGFIAFFTPGATTTANGYSVFQPTNAASGRWFRIALVGTTDGTNIIGGAGLTDLIGDGTASGPGIGTLTLAVTGVTNDVYGSAALVPQFSVDSKGRILGVTNRPVDNFYSIDGSFTSSRYVNGNLTNGLVFQNMQNIVAGATDALYLFSGNSTISGNNLVLFAYDAYMNIGSVYSNLLSTNYVNVLTVDPVTTRVDFKPLYLTAQNIYTTNGSLAGDRIVDGDSHSLLFTNVISLHLTSTTDIKLDAGLGDFFMRTAGVNAESAQSGQLLQLRNVTNGLVEFTYLTNALSEASVSNFVVGIIQDNAPVVNIYNSDGALTGNRTVTGDSHDLTFTGLETFGLSVNGNVDITSAGGIIKLKSEDDDTIIDGFDGVTLSVRDDTVNYPYVQVGWRDIIIDTKDNASTYAGLYLKTRGVNNSSATVGQALVLTNASTGQVEFQTISSGTTINSTDGYIPVRGSSTTFTNSPLFVLGTTNISIGGLTNILYKDGQDLVYSNAAPTPNVVIKSGTGSVKLGTSTSGNGLLYAGTGLDLFLGANNNSSGDYVVQSTGFAPTTDGTKDLGSASAKFKDIYLTTNSVYLGTNHYADDGTTLTRNGVAIGALAGGVTAGTYRSVTVGTNGLVSTGTNPTTFSGYGLSDTSANLAAALTDETGTGAAVFGTSPTITTSLTLTNGTVGTIPLTLQHAAGASSNIITGSVGGTNRFAVTREGNVVIGGSQSGIVAGSGIMLKRVTSIFASGNQAALALTSGDGSEGYGEFHGQVLSLGPSSANGVPLASAYMWATGNNSGSVYVGGTGCSYGFGPGTLGSGSDLYLTRDSAATLQIGADAASVVSPQTFKAADGSGTDKAGAVLQIRGGQSTGTGRGGDLSQATSLTATTGSTANSYSTRSYHSAKPVDLTESTATLFCNVSLATNAYAGVMIHATVTSNDGADYQALKSTVNVAGVNKAGTVTATLAQVDGTTAASSGTLTCTYTAVANGNGIDIKANAVSSLTQTVLRVKWSIVSLESDGVATVTAQ